MNANWCSSTVSGVALDLKNTIEDLTKSEKATLDQIRHANDPNLNPNWGSNPYWGPKDMTGPALQAMADIANSHKNN